MSRPKTVELKRNGTNNNGGGAQQCAPTTDCCDKIREAAYFQWEAAGCPGGDGVEYWLRAEAELATERPISKVK